MHSRLKSRARKTWRWNVVSDFISERGWKRGAELGTLDGRTLVYLLAKHQHLRMISVDMWGPVAADMSDPGDPGYRVYDVDFNRLYYDLYGKITKIVTADGAVPALNRVTFYKTLTSAAATIIEDNSLDFVFIDADHTYKSVKEDIVRWAPKVRSGGMLMGHDADHEGFPGVDRALNELLPGWKLYEDHVWSIPIEDVNWDLLKYE